MINEFTKQLQRFIDTSNNNLLVNEAREMLHCATWFLSPSTFASHHSAVRTEKIFAEHRKEKKSKS